MVARGAGRQYTPNRGWSERAMVPNLRRALMRKLSVLLAAATALLCSCTHRGVEASAPKASDAPVVPIAHATAEDLSRGLVLTAEFRPFQEIDVMAKVAGYIKKINVDVGDHVRQGQLLATLEIPEMGDDLKRADASTVRARAEVARARD